MSALNPWFMMAAASLAVPLFLHLFQRRTPARISFPALRYLERTEREHAKNIRFRQLLLLMLRLGILVAIVGAGARLVLLGPSSGHPPTAIVVVLDNSMSSGSVVGQGRLLDTLKAVALRSVELAGPEDRFWLVRAGEPWVPAEPLSPTRAASVIRQVEPSSARGDLTAALRRAREILQAEPLVAREVHLFSDLQETSFDLAAPPVSSEDPIPVVVWTGEAHRTDNRALVGVLLEGGLAPLGGEGAELTVRLRSEAGDTTPTDVRAVVDEQVRAIATLAPGNEVTLMLPPGPPGWTTGHVEIDADPLATDNRRFFAFRTRPSPSVLVGGPSSIFVSEGVEVLIGSGRARRATGVPQVVIALNGAELSARGPASTALVIPGSDASLVPALNVRLQQAGIAWRYGVRPDSESGGDSLRAENLPAGLEGVLVRRWFELSPDPELAAPSRVLAEVGGVPWAVETRDDQGRRVLLLASPIEATASSLPTSAGWIRLLDWVVSQWASGGGAGTERFAGDPLPAPSEATHVRTPSGARFEIDGTRMVRQTSDAGLYTFLATDTVVSVAAVNPPPRESDLTPLDPNRFNAAFGEQWVATSELDSWGDLVFRARSGPEIWWPLLLVGLLLMLFESFVAAGGRRVRAPLGRPQSKPVTDGLL